MAVATGTVRRRRGADEAAAKAKRQKVFLGAGLVLLVGVLAFQLPKLMKSSSSGSSTASTPTAPTAGVATSTPSTAVAGAAAISPSEVKHDLAAIARYRDKDPFQVQLTTGPQTSQQAVTMAHGPAVRRSHFVVKDPFAAQIKTSSATTASATPATPPPVTSPPPAKTKVTGNSSAPYGYIVILRSLDSKAAALSELKKAHAQGLTTAGVLYSSKYTSLRHGYWVVYLNKYPTWTAANAGLTTAHAHGYASAYRRPVRK
jgi:hypothetical protein